VRVPSLPLIYVGVDLLLLPKGMMHLPPTMLLPPMTETTTLLLHRLLKTMMMFLSTPTTMELQEMTPQEILPLMTMMFLSTPTTMELQEMTPQEMLLQAMTIISTTMIPQQQTITLLPTETRTVMILLRPGLHGPPLVPIPMPTRTHKEALLPESAALVLSTVTG
jgi:hypothetical protein